LNSNVEIDKSLTINKEPMTEKILKSHTITDKKVVKRTNSYKEGINCQSLLEAFKHV